VNVYTTISIYVGDGTDRRESVTMLLSLLFILLRVFIAAARSCLFLYAFLNLLVFICFFVDGPEHIDFESL
jgi:hypothetical protein